jgi:hypothetical protein
MSVTLRESPQVSEDVLALDEGPVVLRMPRRLSEVSLRDFEDWLQLILRKARRSVAGEAGPAAEEEGG